MESELLKTLATYGVGGLLAAFMFLLYRRDLRASHEAHARATSDGKEMLAQVLAALDNNTRAFVRFDATNSRLARAIEHSEIRVSPRGAED